MCRGCGQDEGVQGVWPCTGGVARMRRVQGVWSRWPSEVKTPGAQYRCVFILYFSLQTLASAQSHSQALVVVGEYSTLREPENETSISLSFLHKKLGDQFRLQ